MSFQVREKKTMRGDAASISLDADWDVAGKREKRKKKKDSQIPFARSSSGNGGKKGTSNTVEATPRKQSLTPKPQQSRVKQPGIFDLKSAIAAPQPQKSQYVPPKATKKVALFDLILTSKKNAAPVQEVMEPEKLKISRQDDLKPRNFIANKKRRKNISTIKKRILLVSLRFAHYLHLNNS